MNRRAFSSAIKIGAGVVLASTCLMAESLQISAGYAILGSNPIFSGAEIISPGSTPFTFDGGLLTITESVTQDSSDPNSQWINFEVQPNSGVFPLLGSSGMFEIPLSILPLDVSGTFSGFNASFTGNSAPLGPPAFTFPGATPLTNVAVLVAVMPFSGTGNGISSVQIGVRETGGGAPVAGPPVANPPVPDPPVSDPPSPTGGSETPEPATAGLAGLALIAFAAGARRWSTRNSNQ